MRVAVFGSSYSSNLKGNGLRNISEFDPFCKELGRRLVEEGHVLLVESDSTRTADRALIEGVLEANDTRNGAVQVFHRTSRWEHRPFHEYSEQHRGIFQFHSIKDYHITPTHLRMLAQADVALILGGGPEHTYGAGLAAALLGVRIIPVPYCGGAAEVLRSEMGDFFGSERTRRPSEEAWNALSSDLRTCSDAILGELRSLPRILVVHGHSDDRNLVTEALHRLGVNSVVLRDLSNVGLTITEAFEREASQMDASIALFTPDDFGGAIAAQHQLRRARQNVVLEYGWFWGRLGRQRSLLLMRDEIELPSDLRGLRYQPYTNADDLEPAVRAFVGALRG